MKLRALVLSAVILSLVGCGGSTGGTGGGAGGGSSAGGGAGGGSGGGAGGGTPAPVYTDYLEGTPPAAVAFEDVCATGTVIDLSVSAAITLPFTFHYYAESVTSARISQNGWISFSKYVSGSALSTSHQTLPSTMGPSDSIYVLWHNLLPPPAPAKALCYTTVGTAPKRTFVVQWNQASFYANPIPAGADLTFEARLNEENDTIDILYKTINPTASLTAEVPKVTIGLVDEQTVGGGHVAVKFKQSTTIPVAGVSIRFTPRP